MSRELVESILSKNMLEANDMVENQLAQIRERKMYEMKRMYQAEAFGGLTKDEIADRKKAGYKKASDILGDPQAKQRREIRLNPEAKIIKKKIAEDSIDEDWTRAIKMGIKRTGARLSYARGHALGKAIVGAANIAGKVGQAYDKAQRIVADPIPAAGTAAKAVGSASVEAAKKAGKFGKNVGDVLRTNVGSGLD